MLKQNKMVEKKFQSNKKKFKSSSSGFFPIGSSQKIYAARFTEAADEEKGQQSKQGFCWFQCDQMWQFSAIWAFFESLGCFFLEIYLLLGAFLQAYVLLGAFLLTIGHFFVGNWALFHSNHMVTLAGSIF